MHLGGFLQRILLTCQLLLAFPFRGHRGGSSGLRQMPFLKHASPFIRVPRLARGERWLWRLSRWGNGDNVPTGTEAHDEAEDWSCGLLLGEQPNTGFWKYAKSDIFRRASLHQHCRTDWTVCAQKKTVVLQETTVPAGLPRDGRLNWHCALTHFLGGCV